MRLSDFADIVQSLEDRDDASFHDEVEFHIVISDGNTRVSVCVGGEAVLVSKDGGKVTDGGGKIFCMVPTVRAERVTRLVKVYDDEYDRLSWMPVPSPLT